MRTEMGIDIHVLNFLRFAAKKQKLGRVATVGRQALLLSKSQLQRVLKTAPGVYSAKYCEALLTDYFGATSVESFDNSDYQGATHIVDMNRPLTISNRYDTVIDGGCLEHIYNVVQALKNVSQICVEGGQILHISPANNFCGHGFWQFSPELFFSLYSETNGYSETEVLLADLADERFWYQVRKPENGRRANIISSTPVYALVRTRKKAAVSHDNVQQSDYVHAWRRSATTPVVSGRWWSARTALKQALRESPLDSTARILRQKWQSLRAPITLSPRNSHLEKLPVSSFV
jgi:hypothetical protein